MPPQTNKGLLAFLPIRLRPSLVKKCFFIAHHFWWSAPLRTASFPSQDSFSEASPPFWPFLQLQHQLPNQPCPGPSPWKGPRFLCLLCTLCVPTAQTLVNHHRQEGTRRLQICELQLSKGMCLLSILNYNLTCSKNKNTAMCIFSPEMIIIVLQTFFKLQLPKWKRHFKK